MKKPSVAIVSLGCKTNQWEGQKIGQRLEDRGFKLVNFTNLADVYIINSCAVTGVADKKTRQMARRVRKQSPKAVVAVVGCYVHSATMTKNPGKDGALTLPNGENESDILLGVEDKFQIVDILARRFDSRLVEAKDDCTYAFDIEEKLEERTRSYIKLQDGCDRFCAYCVIPYVRTKLVSRPISELLKEAEDLIANGRKELILTGINIALYKDSSGDKVSELYELVRQIALLDGDFRIRLGSLEPNVFDAKAIKEIMAIPKVCPHLHLSAQSGSDNILKAMNRRYSVDDYLGIVSTLRSLNPNFGLSTDIIVGFPGESEEDFEASCELVKYVKFFHTHIFRYSKRTGTAAAKMSEQIPDNIKKLRAKRLEAVAQEASLAYKKSLAGGNLMGLVIDENRLVCDNGMEIKGNFEKRDINNYIIVNIPS